MNQPWFISEKACSIFFRNMIVCVALSLPEWPSCPGSYWAHPACPSRRCCWWLLRPDRTSFRHALLEMLTCGQNFTPSCCNLPPMSRTMYCTPVLPLELVRSWWSSRACYRSWRSRWASPPVLPSKRRIWRLGGQEMAQRLSALTKAEWYTSYWLPHWESATA